MHLPRKINKIDPIYYSTYLHVLQIYALPTQNYVYVCRIRRYIFMHKLNIKLHIFQFVTETTYI